MIPCHAVAAPAAARRSTLLAEALASRLAEQALCHRQRTSASATRRSPLRRFRGLPAAPPEPHSLTRGQHERGHVLCGGLAVVLADRWHTVRGPRGRN